MYFDYFGKFSHRLEGARCPSKAHLRNFRSTKLYEIIRNNEKTFVGHAKISYFEISLAPSRVSKKRQ